MNQFHSGFDLVRKIGLLALFGFGAIVLSGPILAVLSVVLSIGMVVLAFALVGFLVWFPLRIMAVGSRVAFENVHDMGRGIGRGLGHAGGGIGRLVGFPVRAVGAVAGGGLRLAGATLRMTWSTTRVVSELAAVGLAGGLAGVAMAVVTAPHADWGVAIPTNAVVGGMIGLLTGAVLTVRERRGARATQAIG
jgi:hypothetical protein